MTELFHDFPWLPTLVGALGYFMLGAIWYSKILFAPKWIQLTGINVDDPNAKKGMLILMLLSVVVMFISSMGIAILADRLELHGWMSGLKLGALTGGFGAAAICISYLYEKRPLGLHLINGLYTILGNCIAGVIICMMN